MKDENTKSEFETVSKIISLLENLEKEKQIHILTTVKTWLKINGRSKSSSEIKKQTGFWDFGLSEDSSKKIPKFSDRKELSPKQFMLEKKPNTDIEKIACLAYYLTNYRETPQFKTLDLSKLNTEAAQQKFSNAPQAAKNAAKIGFLVPAAGGKRQISGVGEQFVQALPDREAAKKISRHLKKPRRKKKTKSKSSKRSQKTSRGE